MENTEQKPMLGQEGVGRREKKKWIWENHDKGKVGPNRIDKYWEGRYKEKAER